MELNLKYDNRTNERVGYFVKTTGVNNKGEPIDVVLSHEPHSSGCNPYCWSPVVGTYQRGVELQDKVHAKQTAFYARLSYNVKGIDRENIKIDAVAFKIVKEAILMETVNGS